ncbi:MAG: prepilin-type N-terminal cleavage/methylation domain-containing protein [Deltaproteobacteria bacterium]|nr:prepilin-type N-terminal cleavage/methylation domain-containing protein [Deltaproteobacteria bacterium]
MSNKRGFTLIEIIIALVVFAILATMVVSYTGTLVTESGRPLITLKEDMALQGVMENIRADKDANNNLAALKTAVGTGIQNNSYGVYTVIHNDYIKFNAANYNEEADTAGSTGNDGIDVLKISIKDASGLILTDFFVER